MSKTKKSQKGKGYITLEEYENELLKTPEERAQYEKDCQAFAEEIKNEYLAEIGEEMRKARRAKEMTQAELAARLRTTKSVISRVENGDQNLTIEYALRIAKALGKNFRVEFY